MADLPCVSATVYSVPRLYVLTGCTINSSRFLTWPADAGSQTLDYNIYFNTSGAPRWQKDGTTYTNFSAYQVAAGETHSLYGNPQLVAADNFHLQAGSSAINAGTSLSEAPQDLECTPRPQGSAWDIGADELGPPGSNCSALPDSGTEAGALILAPTNLLIIDPN
jgi:hypothetical protein